MPPVHMRMTPKEFAEVVCAVLHERLQTTLYALGATKPLPELPEHSQVSHNAVAVALYAQYGMDATAIVHGDLNRRLPECFGLVGLLLYGPPRAVHRARDYSSLQRMIRKALASSDRKDRVAAIMDAAQTRMQLSLWAFSNHKPTQRSLAALAGVSVSTVADAKLQTLSDTCTWLADRGVPGYVKGRLR